MDKAKQIATALGKPTKAGNGWKCSCPCHEDDKPSLSVWERDDGVIAVNCFAGCDNVKVRERVADLGIDINTAKPVVYVYETATKVQYRKIKNPGKQFYCDPISHPTMQECPKILYNTQNLDIPENIDKPIFIVEGEKDVDTCSSNDVLATCNFDGAGKWLPEYTKQLAGRIVFIVGDNDTPGLDHAELVYNSLKDDVETVVVLNIEALFKLVDVHKVWKGADITDWFDRGGSKALLMKFAAQHLAKITIPNIREIAVECLLSLENRYLNRDTLSGIQTGFQKLDLVTDGLQEEDMIILAGRPSMGKTALMLNIAQNCSILGESHSLIFSCEMSRRQIGTRLICTLADVDASNARSGQLSKEELEQVYVTVNKLKEVGSRMIIDDTHNLKISELVRKARQVHKKHPLDILMVDYIQLLRGSSYSDKQRYLELGEISSTLKGLAQELSVPILVLSQLSRAVESRVNKRPMASDLRESGAIEQDADLILFLYREEHYNPDTIDKGTAELIISKHRNGATSTLRLGFEASKMRFTDDLFVSEG